MVSVKADMGVLCLLDDLRSRALALPVPFLDAGAMMGCYEGAAVLAIRSIYLVAARTWIRGGIPVAIRVALAELSENLV